MYYFVTVLLGLVWGASLAAAYARGRLDGGKHVELVLKRRLPREHMNTVSAALIDEEDGY